MKDKDDDLKVTLTAGGQSTSTTLGGLKAAAGRIRGEEMTIKRVEDLLEIHNDEGTTKALNAKWKRLRQEVDSRASLDEKSVKGELRIVIKYETEGASGMHEIEVLHDIKLPKERSNKRKMYEDKDGNLTPIKPSKQTELFGDNVTPIRKNV